MQDYNINIQGFSGKT